MEGFDFETIIHIDGKFGCNQTSLCTLIANDINEKISPNINFEFEILFETQLEKKRNELIKEDPSFLEYKESPIIHLTVK